MPYTRKTWKQKLLSSVPPKVVTSGRKFADIPEGATMYIGTPGVVDAYIRTIPAGTPGSIQQMRKDLAAAHHAAYCCPVTAGIFLRIAAEAAYEDYLAGAPAQAITPFWRMVDVKSPLAKKLSCGAAFVQQRQDEES